MNWSTTKSGLSSLITTITGLPTAWSGTSQSNNWFGKSHCLLSLSSPQTVGVDEVVYSDVTDPDPGQELLPTVIGRRTYTFRVRVEVDDQRAANDAQYYTEILRTAMRAPSVGQTLLGLELGFAGVLGETTVPLFFERRNISVAEIDIRLNAASTFADTYAAYIADIEADSVFKDPDGGSSDFNFTNKNFDLE